MGSLLTVKKLSIMTHLNLISIILQSFSERKTQMILNNTFVGFHVIRVWFEFLAITK